MSRTVAEINQIVRTLRRTARRWNPTAVGAVARDSRDPFRVLISCLISLRTKDQVTAEASARLFHLARTPHAMAVLPVERIAHSIYPAGFYRTKARTIRELCRSLLERHGGNVPDDLDTLLSLKGVGRKTANLVVTIGFGKPGICVDTHVHRISNRLGIVETKTPEQTETALRTILPRRHWIYYNDLLVTFGQNVCKPISPLCGTCPVSDLCPRIGVGKHR
ncbi:MAG TPA: endonuclease III [Candidatus Methylomirabilis sp.]|nr:endonuclease III [Candidatus Methylomirabilis sp.]HSC71155.1 endonuclease III [Candidatus Methylomirabilis sp.]